MQRQVHDKPVMTVIGRVKIFYKQYNSYYFQLNDRNGTTQYCIEYIHKNYETHNYFGMQFHSVSRD